MMYDNDRDLSAFSHDYVQSNIVGIARGLRLSD
jgi:hypothetical protein